LAEIDWTLVHKQHRDVSKEIGSNSTLASVTKFNVAQNCLGVTE